MLESQFRQIIITILKENAEAILGRPVKNYEINHFFNMKEEKLNIIIQRAKHNLEIFINEYLEDIK